MTSIIVENGFTIELWPC